MTEDDREELPFVTSILRGAGFQLHAPASWRGEGEGVLFIHDLFLLGLIGKS